MIILYIHKNAIACKDTDGAKMTITSKEIALLAGVSQSTVSRSLNDSPLVSKKTKERIRKIAEEQGFAFNANARSLSTNKTDTIGIIYPDNFHDFSVNLYFSSLHNQLRESLERENLDLIVSFAENKFTKTNNIERLIKCRKVDGLIIVKSNIDNQTINYLKNSRIPFVFMHHFPNTAQLQDIDIVCTDHVRGGYLATEHLIKLGHSKIICISSLTETPEYELRTKGYKAALNDYNIPIDERLILYGGISFKSSYEAIKRSFDLFKHATAVFAENDIMALGVIEALREFGVSVPDDIAVVGFDDIEMSTFFKPYLTTIHQPREEIAMLTCHRLVELINSKRPSAPRKIVIQPKLIVRESCGSNR